MQVRDVAQKLRLDLCSGVGRECLPREFRLNVYDAGVWLWSWWGRHLVEVRYVGLVLDWWYMCG